MAQHGSTSSQRLGLVGRIVDGWRDAKYAQSQLAVKNRPWLADEPMRPVRRIDV